MEWRAAAWRLNRLRTQASINHGGYAIVVGSGATGGWAAKRLSEAGLTVALLEAGRNISPSEFTEHMPGYKLHFRDMSPEIVKTRPVQKQCYACMEYNRSEEHTS